MVCYTGTSGWTYKHWKGNFYPEKLAQKNWFAYYVQNFNAVEINATFYRKFRDEVYIRWKEATPENFRFVLKVPRSITHEKLLQATQIDIQLFCRQALLLGEKLGCVLLQLAPRTPYDLKLFEHAIESFDNRLKVAVEFRNKIWLNDAVKKILTIRNVAFCNADSPDSGLTDWLTSPVGYIRLHGKKNWYSYDYSEHELREIADVVAAYNKLGADTVFVFFNNDYHGNAPRNAKVFMSMVDL